MLNYIERIGILKMQIRKTFFGQLIAVIGVVAGTLILSASSVLPVKADHTTPGTIEYCEEQFGAVGNSDYENCVQNIPEDTGTGSQPVDFGVACDGNSEDCCNGVRLSVGVDCVENAENPILGYLAGIINFLAGGVLLVVTAMIVAGGIQYITAGGIPQRLEAARRRITNAVIALIIFIFLFGILQWLIPGGLL